MRSAVTNRGEQKARTQSFGRPKGLLWNTVAPTAGVVLVAAIFALMQPNPASAICSGCGGSGGVLTPCYFDGEVIYDWTGEVYGTPNGIWREVRSYVAPCQIRQFIRRVSDGFVSTDELMTGGCPCFGADAPYDAALHPSFDFVLADVDSVEAVVVTPEALSSFEVFDVVNATTVFSHGPVAAGDSISIPRASMQNSVFAVEGFVSSGRLDGSLVLQDDDGTLSTGKRLMSWGNDGTNAVRNLAVYLEGGIVKIVRQRNNNFLELVSGVNGGVLVAVGDLVLVPGLVSLAAHPNPASGAVRFATEGVSDGAVLIFSVDGRRVAELALIHGVSEWDGRDEEGRRSPAGIYFAQVEREPLCAAKFVLVH